MQSDFTRLEEGLFQVSIGIAALALSAQGTIEIKGAPFDLSLQTLTILLLPFVFSPKPAIATIVGYIFLGFVGFPFFQHGGSGWEKASGDTAGFIYGFVLAVVVLSWIIRRLKSLNIFVIFSGMIVGHAIILASGFAWLTTHADDPNTSGWLLALIVPAIIKSTIGTLIVLLLRKKDGGVNFC